MYCPPPLMCKGRSLQFFNVVAKLCYFLNCSYFFCMLLPNHRPQRLHFKVAIVTGRCHVCGGILVPSLQTSRNMFLWCKPSRTFKEFQRSTHVFKLYSCRSKMLHAHRVVFEPGEVWSHSGWQWRMQVSFHVRVCLLRPKTCAECRHRTAGGWDDRGVWNGSGFWVDMLSGSQMGTARETSGPWWGQGSLWNVVFKFYSHHILLPLSGLNSRGPKSCFSFLSWSDSWVRQKLGDHCSALRLILCD